MSYALFNSQGDLCCSYCGYIITGNSWQASTVRGFFCGVSCRAAAVNDLDYSAAYPRKAVSA